MPRSFVSAAIALVVLLAARDSLSAGKPNVLLIITDDQGYGDIGIHGNTMIKTPHLDQLARQSVRLTNFHVDPTCAETRSALMTGKYSCRVGVWHTIMGRSILRRDEKTMPQYFAEAGYTTGMFGKWHLGDNYPFRPHDRGFQEALYNGGGGVGQSPDAWGNDYFDDTYMRNGKSEQQTGYCTDVWFRAATQFIEKHKEQPFFCYVATNAPHSPYNVDPKYAEPYLKQGVPQPMANFYGMIANIDENLGKLLAKLDEWKLAENTIVVFMTDNGTAAGVVGQASRLPKGKKKEGEREMWQGFTAGMRAQKGSQYEGGHRVPCFIRWPQDAQLAGRSVDRLTAHFDLLPTLLDLCGVAPPAAADLDGRSLKLLIHGAEEESWRPTRVVHSQRVDQPEKWRKCSVMHQIGNCEWRLVDGKELYDLRTDPGQAADIAADHPDVLRKLRDFYENWWTEVSQRFDEYSDVPLGDPAAPAQQLCCHDWHPEDAGAAPWNQSGQEGVGKDPLVNGQWATEVAQDGNYSFTLRMRPAGTPYKLPRGKARVKIGDVEGTADIPANADGVTINLALKKSGHVMLQTWLTDGDGQSRGAYYVTVKALAAEQRYP
ncbi:MAG TPA: arylsulfatase [Pirellulaceae bacterium]|nr:arylsulfatase [Pirellulaceae bacterium]